MLTEEQHFELLRNCKIGAESIGSDGRKMVITTLPASNLVKKYFKEERL